MGKTKSIGIVEKTIKKNDIETKEIRYYISSLDSQIDLFEKSVRGHLGIEIMHWHLDVTFKEDNNKTIEENTNMNMNIIRKWALSILKLLDMGKKMSLKLKRFSEYISKNIVNLIFIYVVIKIHTFVLLFSSRVLIFSPRWYTLEK